MRASCHLGCLSCRHSQPRPPTHTAGRDLLADGNVAELFADRPKTGCVPPVSQARAHPPKPGHRQHLSPCACHDAGCCASHCRCSTYKPRRAPTSRSRGTFPFSRLSCLTLYAFLSRLLQPPEPFGDAVLVETDVPCSIHKLAHMLFAQGSAFQQSWCAQLGATRVVEGPWSFSTAPDGTTPVASREVSLCTPPPAAWGYLVGNTAIPSRRRMVALRVRSGSEVLVEETTTLEMPFGSTFHSCVQYYMMAVNDNKTHLRVTFKLIFSRFAAMKAVLTTMVRGEHEKIFGDWKAALMAAVSDGGLPRINTAPVSPRAGAAADEAQTPVGMLVAHAPQFAAVFGAGCLAGAALAVACAAVLHALPDAPFFQPAQRWGRLAESAASGVHPHSSSLFLVTVGRALLYARLQPVALAIALLILVLAALALVRVSGADHLWVTDMRRQRGGGAGGGDGLGQKTMEGRAISGQQNAAAAGGRSATSGRQVNGAAGAPAGRQRPLVDASVAAQADAGSDDVAVAAEPAQEVAVPSPGDSVRSSFEAAVPATAPAAGAAQTAPTPPRVVPGPVEAPPDVPTPLLKGVQRLLSKAGRDDAVADFTEVFSVLASDILGKRGDRQAASSGADAGSAHGGSANTSNGAALPSPSRSAAAGVTEDDMWAVEALNLPEDEARGAAVEWVFEHARFMPTLGWSHDYLLPTDRRRWSQFDTAASTDSLRELISLPSGWQWAEVWQKDMRGASSGAVDSQGWSYAVDFPFLHSPPRSGDGRESTMRCVRRRRWVRVRKPVRQEELNELSAAAASAPLSPPVTSPPPTGPHAPPTLPLASVALAAVAEEQAQAEEAAAHGGWEVDLGEALSADAITGAEQRDASHAALAALLQRALHATLEPGAAPHAAPDLVAALESFLDAHGGEGAQRRSPRRLSFEESMWALKTDAARMSISLPRSEAGAAAQPRQSGGWDQAHGPEEGCTKAQLAALAQTAQVSTPERQPVWARSTTLQAAGGRIEEAETRVVGFELL